MIKLQNVLLITLCALFKESELALIVKELNELLQDVNCIACVYAWISSGIEV